MKRRSFIAATMLAASLSSFAAAPTAMAQDSGAYFVDLLILQEGKTPADAAEYFTLIEPVVAEHGLVRALPSFVIAAKMAGEMDADMLNVWTVSNPDSTSESIFSDDAYTTHIPLRNSIFDMQNSHMFMLMPNG